MADSGFRTVSDLSAEEQQCYDPASALHQRQVESRKDLARRQRLAWQAARKAARLLRKVYGAQRVVIFGSLAEKTSFTPWSDIDLAAWGIAPHQFYAAVAAVTGISAEFKIDLVDPEYCRPALLAAIQRDGIEV